MKLKTTLFTLLCSIIMLLSFAQSGELDPEFGEMGRLSIDIGKSEAFVYDVVVAPDGRILLCGFGYHLSSSSTFILALLSNGDPDPEFGTDGIIWIDDWSVSSLIQLAFQDDNKILAATTVVGPDTENIAVLRFNPDGSADPDFGIDGIAVIVNDELFDYAKDMVIDGSGRIIVAGQSSYDNLLVVRFLPDGSPDPSFGDEGMVRTQVNEFGGLEAVLVQNDGKIVAAGSIDQLPTYADLTVIRYLEDGTIDESFGDEGMLVYDVSGEYDLLYDITQQADGKYIAAGYLDSGDNASILLRLHHDGTPDAGFGTDGIVNAGFLDVEPEAQELILQPDGKILLGCQVNRSSQQDFGLMRYHENGTPDTDFGDDGIVYIDFNENNDWLMAMALQQDGRLVAAGHAFGPDYFQAAIARLLTGINVFVDDPLEPEPSISIHPQPVSSVAWLEFDLETESLVQLSLFDITGRFLKDIYTNERLSSGIHRKEIDLSELESGMYILRILYGSEETSIPVLKVP